MRIRFFPAKYSHITELEAINKASMPENYEKKFWALILSQHLSIVAKCDGAIIGYILLGTIDPKVNRVSIISLAVDAEFRSQGIGRELLRRGIVIGRKNKTTTTVDLTVRISNKVAIKLYESNGFNVSETISDYYKNPEEPGLCMVLV